jgi:vacuolar protein sorting-associated protein 11
MLWAKALSFFAEKETLQSIDQGRSLEMTQVLGVIEKKNILSPLQVVQILARNPAVTVGMVRDYLIRKLETEQKSIDEVIMNLYDIDVNFLFLSIQFRNFKV